MPSADLPLCSRPARALYVHLPFCARQCPYCDFATAPLERALEARYLEALAAEHRARVPRGWRARTLFLGGGTPAELSTPGVERLIEILAEALPDRGRPLEATLEANPRTLLRRKLRALRTGLRISRLSLGAQSFDPGILKTLGRFHSPQDTVCAVALAREEGIESVSLDLIFAVPGQTLADLDRDLDALLALKPDHISTYCLTFEPGTAFTRDVAAGRLRPPGDGVEARHYGRVRRRLKNAGFVHYEISNFARPGHLCLHNRIYWRNLPHHGLGTGAASHLGGVRHGNHRGVEAYTRAVEAGGGAAAVADSERLVPARKIRETAYLALRTSEGIVPSRFERDTGVDPRVFFQAEIAKLTQIGLLEEKQGRLRLTGRGVSVADSVAVEIL